MVQKISFGTDGWRGIMAKDFTFDNVRLVSEAVAAYLSNHKLCRQGLVVGYDNRFLSERFAEAVAEVMCEKGIPVFLAEKSCPTPVTAFAVKEYRAAGAVMLTASHNPPEYNGFKFIPDYAGPALPHITKEIEANIRRLQDGVATAEHVTDTGCEKCRPVQPFDAYVKHIAGLIDFPVIERSKLQVVIDPMYGAGIGYLDHLLAAHGATVETLHNYRDVLFGGSLPEPTSHSLGSLQQRVRETGSHLGLALDGDADRFGIIDRNGEYITPNQFLPLLFYHLLTVRGWRGPVARTVATSHLIDRIAAQNNVQVYETPVGFKYIGQSLLEQGSIMGGEESGGLSVQGHIPEKDGILAGLLAAEIVAYHRTSLTDLFKQVAARYGELVSERLDQHTTKEAKQRVMAQLADFNPPALAGQPVVRRVTLDGTKLVLQNGAWVLVRPSGTEPLFRIYVEANSMAELRAIQTEIKAQLHI